MKRGLQILSAEDQAIYADLVSGLFEEEGHAVYTAENGSVALEMCRAVNFDLLVTDHSMPHVDGVELVTRLKERGFAGKIIVHSSQLTERDIISYRELNVDLIVMKGPDTSNLPRYARKLWHP